ncbi:cellulase family glycosylhydrolase [Saccharothrix deserti]|uniref:cellulase family glycosylhydrolase n=1 Tax=Saccharothrix deserti TaxID=2593674 RepID=UPI00131AB1D2|nr:cellulase family glycosylhydrolase [Saccharothrix deserti]
MERAQRPSWRTRLRRAVSIPVALVVTGVLAAGTTPAAQADAEFGVPRSAMDVVAAMQPSWNLGNSLDAIPDETSWNNPPTTKAIFDTLRGQGFRSVRIPVTWSNRQSATAPYTIDAAYLDRVQEIVDWALADGLYVVLNIHHDSWQWIANMPTDHDNVLARFNATWVQIADRFKDSSRRLLFESVNEPVFNTDDTARKVQLLDELNTSFHGIVRESGGRNATRLLVLPTHWCTPDQNLMDDLFATITSLHDPNLVATVHYYSYWPFSVNIMGFTRFDATVEKDMVDVFARMRDTFVAKGIPVYVGEYGLLAYDHLWPDIIERGEVLKYIEALGHQARVAGVTTALWDMAAFLDRRALVWRDPELFALMRSSWHTRSGTASSDLLFVPKSTPITPQTITLNLNGTAFRGLWKGDTRLIEGRDYTVSGNQVTLTAAAVTRLVGDRAYGVNATIQARFSRGVPWSIKVITNDRPVLSDASGTGNSLTVPTRFRGDVLATMEAKYADGSNAGPADWTSFKEFRVNVWPDYTAETITLPSAFFDAVRDDAPVTLTFHFWSGATVTYHVTKSGTSVTGTTS